MKTSHSQSVSELAWPWVCILLLGELVVFWNTGEMEYGLHLSVSWTVFSRHTVFSCPLVGARVFRDPVRTFGSLFWTWGKL